jgi:tryptophan synthase alpha chain
MLKPENKNRMEPHEKISAALTTATDAGRVGLVTFITAGYPEKARFIETLRKVAAHSDVAEVGVPFSDPMADGVTIQRASHIAISNGVSLRWILAELTSAGDLGAPIVLMSYLNPLLAFGYSELAAACGPAGVCGFIVPDLPLEEEHELRDAMDAEGIALIHLVTPATPEDRMIRLCAASRGFIYAVTIKGITGGAAALPAEVPAYLDKVRSHADIPVCAGFGVRKAAQVKELGAHADGVIVGSALVESLESGADPEDFLRALTDG